MSRRKSGAAESVRGDFPDDKKVRVEQDNRDSPCRYERPEMGNTVKRLDTQALPSEREEPKGVPRASK